VVINGLAKLMETRCADAYVFLHSSNHCPVEATRSVEQRPAGGWVKADLFARRAVVLWLRALCAMIY